MITVVFIACLGASCEPVEIRAPMTPLYCALKGGQETAARWIASHPDWTVRGRIACEVGEPA